MRYVLYSSNVTALLRSSSQSYFDQAAEVATLLNIKLTKKSWDGQRILMAGFPIMHLHKYLKVLVQDHSRLVALCEEFPKDPAVGAKAGFDRRVVRIVTPGSPHASLQNGPSGCLLDVKEGPNHAVYFSDTGTIHRMG